MAKLIFIGEKFGGRTYEVLAQRTTVGRSDANTLSIHDSSVSEQHCEIYDNGDDLIIRDLGSRNGTVVNGELLHNAQRPLAHGQVVKFGAIEARLEIATAPSSDTVTDVTAVHFHAQRKAAPPAPSPAVTLDDGATHDASEHTLILPRPGATPPPAITPLPDQSSKPQAGRMGILILAALALGALVWWIFRR